MRRDEHELPAAPKNDRPGDRYQCGRLLNVDSSDPRAAGLCSCELGPTRTGRCQSERDRCHPALTWCGRARRLRIALFVLGVGALIAAGYGFGSTFFKPGELSRPHAQILSGTMESQRCAACHVQAEFSSWLLSASGPSDPNHFGADQVDRCLECHHTQMPVDLARHAHNLPLDRLDSIRLELASSPSSSLRNVWLPSPSFAMDEVACSACHREHRGTDANLSMVSDAQCQTCHTARFGSFATSHPPLGFWPYRDDGEGTRISIEFNHTSHWTKHFPAANPAAGAAAVKFDCRRCHTPTSADDFSRVTDYATACGQCHDQPLQQEAGGRFDLFALPTLGDRSRAAVSPWPQGALGFYDGELSALTLWMIDGDQATRKAIAGLAPAGASRISLASVDPSQPEQREAAETIATAIRSAIDDLSVRGGASRRLTSAPPYETQRVRSMLSGLPPQWLWDARQRWFGEPPSVASSQASLPPRRAGHAFWLASDRNRSNGDSGAPSDRDPDDSDDNDLLGLDPLTLGGSDPLADQPQMSTPSKASRVEANPEATLFAGGWYRDDRRMAITYQAFGHADPVLKAAVELASGLPEASDIRRQLLSSGPVAACARCHPGAASPADQSPHDLAVGYKGVPPRSNWKAHPVGVDRASFTKFAHRPHLNLPELADCSACHTVAPVSSGQRSTFGQPSDADPVTQVSGSNHPSGLRRDDFLPVSKALCAACHTSSAAGDSCTKCHRYHVSESPDRSWLGQTP